MNTDRPLAVFANMLTRCANTSSKKEKEAIVAAAFAADEYNVCRLFTYALSPFFRFGIQQMPDIAPVAGASQISRDLLYGTLDKIANRSITGNAAREAVSILLMLLPGGGPDISEREAARRVVLKDLRVGIDASTVNKVRKGLIPVFPYMRCSLLKDVDIASLGWLCGVYSQEKADGMFVNLDFDDDGNDVTLTSRQGTELPIASFGGIAHDVRKSFKRGTQTHGELLVLRDGHVLPREIGNGILNSVIQGGQFGEGETPSLRVWDQIPLCEVKPKGRYVVPYKTRFNALAEQVVFALNISLIETRLVISLEDAYDHYFEIVGKGKEGTIIKSGEAIWRDGTSRQQVKLKVEVVVDLEITGFIAGNGKNADTFGSVVCQTCDGELEVCVSGFSDAKRAEIHAAREAMPGKIMSVKANSIMSASGDGKHSLFLPRYVEIRTDKLVADSYQDVCDQFASAMKAA